MIKNGVCAIFPSVSTVLLLIKILLQTKKNEQKEREVSFNACRFYM